MMKLILSIVFIFTFSCISFAQSASQMTAFSYSGASITSAHDALLYPNPVINNKLTVKSTFELKSVDVINVIGQTMLSVANEEQTNEMHLQLDDCEKGLYLIKVTFQDNKSIIKKVLVK